MSRSDAVEAATAERWLLDVGAALQGSSQVAAPKRLLAILRRTLATLPPNARLWLLGAAALDRRCAAVVAAATRGRTEVWLVAPCALLPKLSLLPWVSAIGARGVVFDATPSEWPALRARLAHIAGTLSPGTLSPNAKLPTWALRLTIGAGDHDAIAHLHDDLAKAAPQGPCWVELRPALALATAVERSDASATLTALRALDCETEPPILLAPTWPACVRPSNQATIAETTAAIAAANQQTVAGCADCLGQTRGCLGVPAAFVVAGEATVWPETTATRGHTTAWHDTAEWHALELGLRRVWRADLSPDDAAALAEAARKRGWAALQGPKIAIDARGLWSEQPDATRVLLYVGPDAADQARAAALERATLALGASADGVQSAEVDPAADNDAEMAELLGYPLCCTRAFIDGHQHWRAADAGQIAEVAFFFARAADATTAAGGVADRRLDFISPLVGATAIRHYPCRLDCAASLALVAACDAAADRAGPAVALRRAAARADAVIVFSDGAALPLRGERATSTASRPALRKPRPVLDAPVGWAPRWQQLLDTIAPRVAAAAEVTAVEADAGEGGIIAINRADDRVTLRFDDDQPGFPRLVVYAAEPSAAQNEAVVETAATQGLWLSDQKR